MTRQPQRSGNDNLGCAGFTLIEVLIAAFIFAVGFLAIAMMQIAAGKSNRTATDVTFAVNIASGQIERLLNLPASDSDLDTASNPHTDTDGAYSIQWTVTDSDLSGDGTNDAKVIDMTVSWNDYLGNAGDRSISLSTIKPDV